MKNVKFILIAATFLAMTITSAAWAQATTAAATAPQDDSACIVNPAAPPVHPKKKYVHLHKTPQTNARTKALVAMHRHQNLPVAINICPPEPRTAARIVAPAKPLCRGALGASEYLTADQVQAMMVAAGYNSADPASLNPSMGRAMQANPGAAPALYAYAIRQTKPYDQTAINQLSKTAIQTAPGQAAGLAYGGVAANPWQNTQITQALLANANPSDAAVIRQCAVDANPDLRTGAFVPALAPAASSIGQNDIRNNINNAVGVQTLVPGLEAREKDDSRT